MSAETQPATSILTDVEEPSWLGGAVAGLAGGVVFGLMLSMQMPSIMSKVIPALFGLSGWVAGWIIHLGWSVVWGLVFAGIVSRLDWGNDLAPSTGAGLVYGVGLWVINIVFIWPIWLQAVGFPKAPTVPNIAVMPLIGHVMFGIVVGVVYPFLNGE